MHLFSLLVAVMATVMMTTTNIVSGASDGNVFWIEFDVRNLDGKPGAENQGTFVMEVHEEWAPLGVARIRELVDTKFFNDLRFFRVINGFMAQFGISGDPEVSDKWRPKKIGDDPVKMSNLRSYVSFATSGPKTRTTQLFINFGNNKRLDNMGFSPFAKVIKGMDVVDRIYKIGEKPNQGRIQNEGNEYLQKDFPELTYIHSATFLSESPL